MLHWMGQIRDELNELQKKASEARLPSDKKTLLDCFLPFFNQFHKDFNSAQDIKSQQFYFAVLYGLIKIHSEQLKPKLVAYQSHVGYLRSFIETDASQTYYQSLVEFLNDFEDDFQTYRGSLDAQQYIVYTEAPRMTLLDAPHYQSFYLRLRAHQYFSFGSQMLSENSSNKSNEQATTFAQLAKRIFAITYFAMYEHELDSLSFKNTQKAIAVNGAALLFAPVAVPIMTLAATGAAYYMGHVGPNNHPMKEALTEALIRNDVSRWDNQLKSMLSQPKKSDEALKKLEGGTFSKLKLF